MGVSLQMNRTIRLVAVCAILLAVCLVGVAPIRAAGAPIITRVESQVTVLGDGALDIKYRLTFSETDVRSGITTMGPFDSGHEMLDSHIETSQGERPVTLNSKGGGFYGVDFGFNTVAGEDYTVYVHYRVPYALDETSVDGASYRVLEWSPIEWTLEIGEQVVTFILPIELPADVMEPEQVTDELVDASGLLVNESNISSFDRWVYYPTPDETTGKSWLSIYVSKENVPPEYHFRPLVYLPSTYFSGPVALPTEEAGAPDITIRSVSIWATEVAVHAEPFQ